jgi:ERF superfamily
MTDLVPAERPDPYRLLSQAIERGASIETVERLVALAQEMRALQAREAWFTAIARFQDQCPVIYKTASAKIQTSRASFSYNYAPLPEILAIVQPVMAPLGLSVSWRTPRIENDRVVVSCRIAHALGHTEDSGEIAMPIIFADPGIGATPPQRVGIALSYAKRYALLGILGLAPEEDDDAASLRPASSPSPSFASPSSSPSSATAPSSSPSSATSPSTTSTATSKSTPQSAATTTAAPSPPTSPTPAPRSASATTPTPTPSTPPPPSPPTSTTTTPAPSSSPPTTTPPSSPPSPTPTSPTSTPTPPPPTTTPTSPPPPTTAPTPATPPTPTPSSTSTSQDREPSYSPWGAVRMVTELGNGKFDGGMLDLYFQGCRTKSALERFATESPEAFQDGYRRLRADYKAGRAGPSSG